jgi:lysozyme
VAIPLIQAWEGLPCEGDRCASYLDTIASPPVWTVCEGITGPEIGPETVMTRAQCASELALRVEHVYWTGFRNSLTETGFGVLVVGIDAAFTSLTYNIGTGAVSRSTAVRRLNVGDTAGACEALTWFNRAGQRIVRGLVNRRGCEQRVCLGQVTICVP